MKRKIFFILFIVLSLVSACGKKDVSLLDQLPASPVVNPDIKFLIRDNNLIDAQAYGSRTRGITRQNLFYSDDEFKTINISATTLPTDATMLRSDSSTLIAVSSPMQQNAPVRLSFNYGTNWSVITPTINGAPGIPGTLVTYYVTDPSTLLAVSASTDPSPTPPVSTTSIYRINPVNGNGTLYSTIPGYFAQNMKFYSAANGYILLTKPEQGGQQKTYIAKTTNGGQSWSTPLLVSNSYVLRMAVGPTGNLFLYSGNEGGYFSTDGTSWTPSNSNSRFYSVNVTSPTVLYATVEYGLVISTDGGLTWTDIQMYKFINHKLQFENELHGIAWTDKTLFETKDGGNTWKTLVFPYSYVMD